jgi:hypothetical protein
VVALRLRAAQETGCSQDNPDAANTFRWHGSPLCTRVGRYLSQAHHSSAGTLLDVFKIYTCLVPYLLKSAEWHQRAARNPMPRVAIAAKAWAR